MNKVILVTKCEVCPYHQLKRSKKEHVPSCKVKGGIVIPHLSELIRGKVSNITIQIPIWCPLVDAQ